MGTQFLLQGIFLTQGLKPDLPHCRQILYHQRHQGSDVYMESCLNINISDLIKPNAGYNIRNLFSGWMSISFMFHLAYSHHANSCTINILLKSKLKMYNKIRFFYLLGCLYYPRIKKVWGSENHFVNVTYFTLYSNSWDAEKFHLVWDHLENCLLLIFSYLESECSYSSKKGFYFLNNARNTESTPCFFLKSFGDFFFACLMTSLASFQWVFIASKNV